MGTMVSGALLPCGVGNDIEPAIVEGLESLQQYVGGMIDAVRTELEDGTVIVGYVNDEGLMLNMETNWFASALFNRQIVGDVVLVSGTSPSGEYDGENYDLPESFFQFLTTKFTEHVAETYNEATTATIVLGLAESFGLATKEELELLVSTMAEEINTNSHNGVAMQMLTDLTNKVNEKLVIMASEAQGASLVNEIEDFLKGNS